METTKRVAAALTRFRGHGEVTQEYGESPALGVFPDTPIGSMYDAKSAFEGVGLRLA